MLLASTFDDKDLQPIELGLPFTKHYTNAISGYPSGHSDPWSNQHKQKTFDLGSRKLGLLHVFSEDLRDGLLKINPDFLAAKLSGRALYPVIKDLSFGGYLIAVQFSSHAAARSIGTSDVERICIQRIEPQSHVMYGFEVTLTSRGGLDSLQCPLGLFQRLKPMIADAVITHGSKEKVEFLLEYHDAS